MPRIRSIKPEFPHDETLGRVSRDARLMFILLWTCADDAGRFRASPAYLRGQLFPFDDDIDNADIETWLKELESTGRVKSYRINAETYSVVTNWAKHQRVDNASRRTCPPPPWESEDVGETPKVTAVNGKSRSEAKREEVQPFPDVPTPAEGFGEIRLDRDRDRDRDPSLSSVVTNTATPETGAGDEREPDPNLKTRRGSALGDLARHDLDAHLADGNEVRHRQGFLKAARAHREQMDGDRLTELALQHPNWTGKRLAQALLDEQVEDLPPQPTGRPSCPECGMQDPGLHICAARNGERWEPGG